MVLFDDQRELYTLRKRLGGVECGDMQTTPLHVWTAAYAFAKYEGKCAHEGLHLNTCEGDAGYAKGERGGC